MGNTDILFYILFLSLDFCDLFVIIIWEKIDIDKEKDGRKCMKNKHIKKYVSVLKHV